MYVADQLPLKKKPTIHLHQMIVNVDDDNANAMPLSGIVFVNIRRWTDSVSPPLIGHEK